VLARDEGAHPLGTRFAVTGEIREKLATVAALLADSAAPEVASEALGAEPSVGQTMPLSLFRFCAT
jgi:hypothetical protein